MFKNVYFYRARLFPALITSIPMLVFFNNVLALKYYDVLKNIYNVLPVITHFGLSSAIIFLCVQVNRLIAKEVFQRIYFKDELFMPTTTHVLLSNTYYVASIKSMIRSKIQTKFKIQLLDEQEEQQDETIARKLIAKSISQIRIALKENKLLLQHNIEYGFMRNMLGGCLLAIVFSTIIFYNGISNKIIHNETIGAICFIIYLIPLLMSKFIMSYYSKYYSKILFEQFLNL